MIVNEIQIPTRIEPSVDLIKSLKTLSEQELVNKVNYYTCLRKEAGITMSQICLSSRLSTSQVSRIENISSIPTPVLSARYIAAIQSEIDKNLKKEVSNHE